MATVSIPQPTLRRHNLKDLLNRIRYAVPEGRPLPLDVWRPRHRVILILLWLHALAIVVIGVIAGYGPLHSLAEGSVVAAMAALAAWPQRGRRFRSLVASIGLVTASGFLVHLLGGYVEVHFHFFVMVVVIALYHDWVPFLGALAYVVVEHGVVGALEPTAVYNHPDA